MCVEWRVKLLLGLNQKPIPREGGLHPIRNVTPIAGQLQHSLADLKETFWGDVYGKAKGVLEGFLEEESTR